MERDGIVERVSTVLGPAFQTRLALLGTHPLVGEARGLGLIGAVELVKDKGSKEQFDPKVGLGAKVNPYYIQTLTLTLTLSNPNPNPNPNPYPNPNANPNPNPDPNQGRALRTRA